MIVFDTEDNSRELLAAGKSGFDKKVLQIAAVASNGKRFHNTGNPVEFLKWCKTLGGDVWAFNAQYDIGNLCHRGSSIKLDDFDFTMVKGRFIKGSYDGVKFFDVHNLTGAGSSVKSLGKAVGLEKLEFDANGKAYVFRDCEIPLRWLKFVAEQCEEFGIEGVPATLGGLCTKAFAGLGYTNWHDSSEQGRAALTGGRVELFSGGGTGRICYADVNSLYPWAMTQNFPTHLENLDGLDGYGVAMADVTVPATRVAPLPCKDEDGRLLFPVGKFSGVWTLAELRDAVRHGTKIRKLYWSVGSLTGQAFYRDYILEMYRRRRAAKSDAENLFYKLLMNNLYGRLAIGGTISRTCNLTTENQGDGIPYGRKILRDLEMPLPEFTNYVHAAHVLAYGRLRLLEHLRQIPADDLIYCDTDSAIFFCQGSPPFPTGKELGQMKIESWVEKCIPYLPKTYQYDETYKAKGVPKSKARDFIETGRAEYDLPYKLREGIRFFDAANSHKVSVWRKVEKIRQTEYDRKKVSGNYFLPKNVNW